MGEVKLTVRLPERLHGALRAKARSRNQSLNRAMVDALAQGLATIDAGVAPERDAGTGHEAAGEIDHAALRRAVGDVPPLSAAIVEDRGPA